MAVPGVIGVGVGASEKTSREAAIEIYVKEAGESMLRALPKSLDGVEVKIIETGEIHAY